MGQDGDVAVIGAPVRTWRFRISGSEEVFSLPLMGSLPMKDALALNTLASATRDEQVDAAVELFDRMCPGLTDIVTLDQLTDVVNGWREASGIAPGESPASSES